MRILITSFLSLLVSSHCCVAETAYLHLDNDTFAQAWLFQSRSGECFGITPRHVLEPNVTERTPIITDQFGNEGIGVNITVPIGRDIDLAVFKVIGSVSERCSNSRLYQIPNSYLSVTPSWTSAFLQVHSDLGIQLFHVQISDRSRDSVGGNMFAIEIDEAQGQFRQGMSGGAIVNDAGQTFGMLLEVNEDEGYGLAIRFDFVRQVIEPLLAEATQLSAEPIAETLNLARIENGASLLGSSGTTVDERFNVLSILQRPSPESYWLVRTDNRAASIEFLLSEPNVRIDSVGITLPSQGLESRPVAVSVETQSNAIGEGLPRWSFASYCEIPQDYVGLVFTCNFAPRYVSALRLSFVANDDSAILLLGSAQIVPTQN